ncbi:MAG: SpoIIE family protein phosphatase [Epsilonproteobacteria bacterium]|nr:SpoIIE family protein phosphatase [Campylobacterota bacterium]
MKVRSYSYSSINELKNIDLTQFDSNRVLIQVFSGFVNKEEIQQIQSILNTKTSLPYIGITTAGEIYNGQAHQSSIVVSVVEFEKTTVECAFFANENDFELGVDVAKKMFRSDTKAAIIFLSGIMTNGEDVVDGITSINNQVVISGGVAGDNGNLAATFAFNNEIISDKGCMVASLNSEVLHVINDYQLNWKPFGKVMRVTKAQKNHLFDIDNMRVAKLYRKYLGDTIADGLPLSATEFPLIKNDNGVEICRAFAYMFDDGSFLTIGNLYEGDTVQFSVGNVNLIVNQTKYNIDKIFTTQPEVIFTYSCAGRIAFLQSQVNVELQPLNDIAPIVGFFTYGEILHKHNKNYLMNYTLTFLALSEEVRERRHTTTQVSLPKNLFEDKHFIILDALTNLSNEVIKELAQAKEEIEIMHKHTKDSIQYASLIQDALLPDEKLLSLYFKDSFVYWKPKDVVGGDIWLFDRLRNPDECLLMCIDCTGHGVPGAFVTMIVKSIEREIVSKLKKHPEYTISPAKIMAYFNRTMKKLLHQETKDSSSNAGFDGGILYYNKAEQVIRYSGAQTPLFYIDTDGSLNVIKADKYSVGYRTCDMNYEYSEYTLDVKEGMKFFISTDGYFDQNGGKKGFPFGKKRFMQIIAKHYQEPMQDLKQILIDELQKWQNAVLNNEQNDDITVIGLEIPPKVIHKDPQKVFKYDGVITQNVIATAIDNIEQILHLNLIGKISTITIEMCQNIMHYSKDEKIGTSEIIPRGHVEIQYRPSESYEIIAKNIISQEDKDKIKPILEEIKSLDKASIKKRYRELRKSGANSHQKGGGIGLYEIAKLSDRIAYNFEKLNKEKYLFTIKAIVNINKSNSKQS